MYFLFSCPKCNKQVKLKENKAPLCVDCNLSMKRVWKCSLQIEEAFKSENAQEISYVKEIMKKSPSGKNKIYY